MKPYYKDDFATIWHGDCREIPVANVDLIITDPPYKHAHVSGAGIAYARPFYAGGALAGMQDFVLSEFAELLAQCQQLVAFHSRDLIEDWARFCRERFKTFDLHVWHKVNAIPFVNNTWKSDLEYIALAYKKKLHAKVPQHDKSKLFQSGIDTENLHPAQKPLALIAKYLRVLQPRNVLDPFMGSGTTLRAAKDLGLQSIGIEVEERYCEVAAGRLAQSNFQFSSPKPLDNSEQLGIILA